MGSTSETYENGTNVVVYVANENAHIQSRQHQYHSHNIVSSNLHASNDNETVYNVCAEYRPPSVTFTGYDTITVNKSSQSLDIREQQDGRDDCTISGDYMRDNNEFANYNGDDSEKLAVINNCRTGLRNIEHYVEKFTDSTVNLVPNADGFVRSESVRSVDSVASNCSSLSSSSVGNLSKVPAENFANYVVNADCASDAISGQTVGFSSFRVVPFLSKETAPRAFQKAAVSAPFGWKRLLSNGSVIYIRLVQA